MYPVNQEPTVVNDYQENYHSGWIKIYRSIKKHWIWSDSKYFKAWIQIILDVNHSDSKVLIEGELLDCKRGQSLKSLTTWTKEFGVDWSVQKTRTFFDLLKKDGMIVTEGLRKTTRLTICNYDSYQNMQQADNKQTTDKQQSDNNQGTTNKNEKKLKNEKKIYIPEYLEFKEHAISQKPNIDLEHLKLKYDAWISNGWKNGNNKSIVNWKSALNNTLPYLKEIDAKKQTSLLGY